MLIRIEMTLYTIGLVLQDRVDGIRRRDRESGALTTEQAMWTIGVIILAAVVYGVIKVFVTKQTDNINNTGVLQ